jgi:hypothetical protein
LKFLITKSWSTPCGVGMFGIKLNIMAESNLLWILAYVKLNHLPCWEVVKTAADLASKSLFEHFPAKNAFKTVQYSFPASPKESANCSVNEYLNYVSTKEYPFSLSFSFFVGSSVIW